MSSTPTQPNRCNVAPMDKRDIGRQIAELRQERGLTLRAAAPLCGVAFSTLGQIEHGKINITLDTLDAIAHGLGGVACVGVVDASEPAPLPAPPTARRGVARRFLEVLPHLPSDEIELLLVQMEIWERRYLP